MTLTDLVVNGIQDGIGLAFEIVWPLLAIIGGSYLLSNIGFKLVGTYSISPLSINIIKFFLLVVSVGLIYLGARFIQYDSKALIIGCILVGGYNGLNDLFKKAMARQ